MDIPDYGAVITFGKSRLSDDHKNYFYIQNDPIKDLICGSHQSAVICETGRIFVWGENTYRQLGLGNETDEIVTKPSCIKAIKYLGHKARTITFGETFAIILTEKGKVFFTGMSIFPDDCDLTTELIDHDTDRYKFAPKPIELHDFERSQDTKDTRFVDVSAGSEHFVVLATNGRVFGWGNNQYNQYGVFSDSEMNEPVLVSGSHTIKLIKCGRYFTAMISVKNEVLIVGTIMGCKRLSIFMIKPLDKSIEKIHVDPNDVIYLIYEGGNIYQSSVIDNIDDLKFTKFTQIDAGLIPIDICTGRDLIIFRTKFNEMYTNFSEDTMTTDNGFHQINSLKDYEVQATACGLNHVIVLCKPKSIIADLNLENNGDVNKESDIELTKILQEVNLNEMEFNNNESDLDEQTTNLNDETINMEEPEINYEQKDNEVEITKDIPVNENNIEDINHNQMTPEIYSSVEMTSNENEENTPDEIVETKSPVSTMKPLSSDDCNTEDSIDSYPTVISLKKKRTATPIPVSPRSLKSNSSNIPLVVKDKQDEIEVQLMKDEVIEVIAYEDDTNGTTVTTSIITTEAVNSSPATTSSSVSSNNFETPEIKFINDGVEVKADEIVTNKKTAFKSKFEEVLNTITKEHIEESMLGEKLDRKVQVTPFITVKEETMLALKSALDEADEPVFVRKIVKTPMPPRDASYKDDIESTTASVRSDTVSRVSPLDKISDTSDEIVREPIVNKPVPVEDGKIKRFFKEIRDSSCSNSCKVAPEEHRPVKLKSLSVSTSQLNTKSQSNKEPVSQVCTIL